MSETLSVKLDAAVKKRLVTIANRSKRSESVVAAEAIAAYVNTKEWELTEIRKGIQDADRGRVVSHERVSEWLKTWGKAGQRRS
jgi:RHH-type transcriptional regulator, rel operon repressor / antitoxin RelB